MGKGKNQVMIGVYVSQETKDALQKRAKIERRAISQQAALYIERALGERPSDTTLAQSA
ncbi:MAG TPA: hypothetical protein VKQ36_15745 [Ktedonobacterales bacterium]|nr:hypothetical protein [Ktedonobacterales bacterium]